MSLADCVVETTEVWQMLPILAHLDIIHWNHTAIGWAIGWVIALEADQPWLPHLQKLPVCIVMMVILRSHPTECQNTSCKTHTYCSDSLRQLLRPSPWTLDLGKLGGIRVRSWSGGLENIRWTCTEQYNRSRQKESRPPQCLWCKNVLHNSRPEQTDQPRIRRDRYESTRDTTIRHWWWQCSATNLIREFVSRRNQSLRLLRPLHHLFIATMEIPSVMLRDI